MNQRQLEGWNFRWINSAQEGLSSYPLHWVWIVSYVKPIRLSWALGVSPPPIDSAAVFRVTQKVSYVSPSIWTSKAWAEGRWIFSRLSPHHGIVSRTIELCVGLVGTRFVQYRKQCFLSELEINLDRALPVLLLIHAGKPRLKDLQKWLLPRAPWGSKRSHQQALKINGCREFGGALGYICTFISYCPTPIVTKQWMEIGCWLSVPKSLTLFLISVLAGTWVGAGHCKPRSPRSFMPHCFCMILTD